MKIATRRTTLARTAWLGMWMVLALALGSSAAWAAKYDLPADMKAHLESLPDDNLRVEYLTKELAKSPDRVDLLFRLGNLYYDMTKMDDAVKNFERAVELDPQFVGALVNLGGAYDELGRLDDALEVYNKALAIEPDEDRTLCNIGGVYFRKRQYRAAIDHFEKALAANPKSQLAHYNLAILFADNQVYREAINEWQACVDIDADSDLGQRSQKNIEIIHQMMTAETPELPASGS